MSQLRSLMRQVPTSVTVVTVAAGIETRGITCSSFYCVSFNPPIISFSIRLPSQSSEILSHSKHFAVNILANNQISQSIAFSSTKTQHKFTHIPHSIDQNTKLPLLNGCIGSLVCSIRNSMEVGDHLVYFGNVDRVVMSTDFLDPLIYYKSTYRNVGDELLLHSSQKKSFSLQEWTHLTYVKIAWIHLKEHGTLEAALPLIRYAGFILGMGLSGSIEFTHHEMNTMNPLQRFMHSRCSNPFKRIS
jgi:flavin reductase (DIM6/NTAB) family NADH-FMN oxidoreductase RutF